MTGTLRICFKEHYACLYAPYCSIVCSKDVASDMSADRQQSGRIPRSERLADDQQDDAWMA